MNDWNWNEEDERYEHQHASITLDRNNDTEWALYIDGNNIRHYPQGTNPDFALREIEERDLILYRLNEAQDRWERQNNPVNCYYFVNAPDWSAWQVYLMGVDPDENLPELTIPRSTPIDDILATVQRHVEGLDAEDSDLDRLNAVCRSHMDLQQYYFEIDRSGEFWELYRFDPDDDEPETTYLRTMPIDEVIDEFCERFIEDEDEGEEGDSENEGKKGKPLDFDGNRDVFSKGM